jgi:hypothetical protein
MQTEQFNRVIQELENTAKEIRELKGKDYSDGFDRLSNFKKIASQLGLDPIQVWAVYFLKHIDSISTFVRTNALHSEPIEERFCDALNYLYLGYAIHKESAK